MCFSAAGSFTLAGVLTGIGVAGVARNSHTPYRLFAATPLLFAAQQATEGVVWMTFPPSAETALHTAATVAFLTVAMVIWPVWVSLALLMAEREAGRRRVLAALVAFGGCVATVSALLLVRDLPVATIAGHSIRYDSPAVGGRVFGVLALVAYLVATLAPFFVATIRLSKTIGATLVMSLALTLLVERDALTSVWCFFAAILSIQTLWALEGERRTVAWTDTRHRTARTV